MGTNYRNPGLLSISAGVGLAVIFAALGFARVLDTKIGLGLAVASLLAASFLYIFYSRANVVARTGYASLLMIIAVALLIPLLTVNQQQQQASAAAQLYDQKLQTSAAVFAQYCATCHGLQGQGLSGPQLNNNSTVNKLSDDDLNRIISGGISGNGDPTQLAMPAWSQAFGGSLTEEDINNLVAFIRSSDPTYRKANKLENVNGFDYIFGTLTSPTQIAQYKEQKQAGSKPPASQFKDETGKSALTIDINDTPAAANALWNFAPQYITVSVGTKVTWDNVSNQAHTVWPLNPGDTFPKSPVLAAGTGTYSYTFTKAGEFEYYCSIHPAMTAWIIVK
jgi:plastocyanin/mono/diheme cytochrome c family protein